MLIGIVQAQTNIKNPLFDFDKEKPMFSFTSEQFANQNRFLRYYSLTGYREGVEPIVGQMNTAFGVTTDNTSGTRRIYYYNVSLEELLTHFHDFDKPPFNTTIILEVKDPSKYHYLPEYGPKIDWMRKNAVCFELMIPEGTLKGSERLPNGTVQKGTIDRILSEVLNLNFGYEKRQINGIETSVFVIGEPGYKGNNQ